MTKTERFISEHFSNEVVPRTLRDIPRQYDGQLQINSFDEMKQRLKEKELYLEGHPIFQRSRRLRFRAI